MNDLWRHLERVQGNWVRHSPEEEGEVCAAYVATALPWTQSYITPLRAISIRSESLLLGVIRENYGSDVRCVADWNDEPGRQQSEVEAMIEKAAVRHDELYG